MSDGMVSSHRCKCNSPVQRQLDPDTVDCELCGGWVALRITTMEAWERFKEKFVKPPPPEKAD